MVGAIICHLLNSLHIWLCPTACEMAYFVGEIMAVCRLCDFFRSTKKFSASFEKKVFIATIQCCMIQQQRCLVKNRISLEKKENKKKTHDSLFSTPGRSQEELLYCPRRRWRRR